MEHCPTCGTGFRGEAVCSRCGTDLSEVLALERVAAYWNRCARVALQAGCAKAAYACARRAVEIHRSNEAVQGLALAALACHRFEEALRLYMEDEKIRRDEQN